MAAPEFRFVSRARPRLSSRDDQSASWAAIDELRQERRDLAAAGRRRAAGSGRRPRARRARRRSSRSRRRCLAVVVTTVLLIAVAIHVWPESSAHSPPSAASLAGLSLRQRIVAIARSQIGYRTDPRASYCNKFSAYWHAGATGCPAGEASEEWCADFAAWVWQRAGVALSYGFAPGEINASAASFYAWGLAHGRWHPAVAGYVAHPGDLAIYGLRLAPTPRATHIAIVTADTRGRPGPDVINGDGDRGGFSLVEPGTDQTHADATRASSLAGYVSPP